MTQLIFKSIVYFLVFKLVKSMSLGVSPHPVTRYDPCGLGIIHLDKINSSTWSAIINFDLYPKLIEANIEIHFKVNVNITQVSQNDILDLKENSRTVTINPFGEIPKKIWFYLGVEENATPIIKKLSLNNEVLCSEHIKKSRTIEESFDKSGHICGRRTSDHTEFVTTGGESNAGDWPWHVAIYIMKTDGLSYQCGGSVISRDTVVTAGHCVTHHGKKIEPNNVIVIAGTANLSDPDAVGRQRFEARKIVIHPSYNDSLATADLAIIKVDGFTFTEYVQPICVYGPVYDKDLMVGRYATVVGFGQTENNTNSDILRSAYTQVQSDTTCTKYAPNLYPRLLDEFTFCAGFGPKSRINPRNGDSGGGLVMTVMQPDHRVSWHLRGVLSKCGLEDDAEFCDPKFYVVYVDVSPHYSWILHHAKLNYGSNLV